MPDFGINRRRSVDYTSSTQSTAIQRNRVSSQLGRPRRQSMHGIRAPLSDPPSLPNQQYKESLRYHPQETSRVVMQETVDRTTQKNLSRNAKEVLTGDTRFWDESGDQSKGTLGLGRKATTLKKLTLNRRRMDLIDHASIRESRRRIEDIANSEEERMMRLFGRNGDQQTADEDKEAFQQLMTTARRNVDDVLSVLDLQIETLKSRVTKQIATPEETRHLTRLKQHRTNVERLAKHAFKEEPGINDWGVYHNASTRLARLDNYLLSSLKPDWDPLRMPRSLVTLSNPQALERAGKPQVETLSARDKARMAKSERLQTLGKVLALAVDEGRMTVSVRGLYGKRLAHSNHNLQQKAKQAEREELASQKQEYGKPYEGIYGTINSYAKLLDTAEANGIQLLDDYDLPPNTTYKDHFTRIMDEENGVGLMETFRQIDEKLDALKQEHRDLANDLKPKNWLQRKWGQLKGWFQSKIRKTGTEVTAFSTEFGLASNEAHEAMLELKESSEPSESEAPESEPPETIDTPVYVAKDLLHGAAIVKNLDDVVRIRQERAHLKHKVHQSKEKLEEHELKRETMDPVQKYRSGVIKALYEKTGDQSLAMTYLEEAVGETQIARHMTTMVHDTLVKSGVVGHGVKMTGAGGLFGAAAAEYTEGFIGGGKAISAQMIVNQLSSRLKEVRQQLAETNDPDLVESLKFQERTLQDLSDQQERITNVVSSLKGFGMGTGYTLMALAAIGVASTGVAAPVLLAIFAGTQVGLKAYKVAKASKESWKVDRTEDLILGRGGGQKFLDDLLKEAQESGATPEQIALTRICRGKGPEAKRASSRKLLHDLKWETRTARLEDKDAADIANLQDNLDWRIESLKDPTLDGTIAQGLKEEIANLEQQLGTLQSLHAQKVMESDTAKTLRDAFGMSESEIVAVVDAPNDDVHDELGVRLINEYQNELTE